MDNVRDIMRNPERVLNSLCENSKRSNYKFERLYRVLFNAEMFYLAYQRIYANTGSMTKGSDETNIDQMSLSRIERLIGALKDESYRPKPSRRTFIPKKNGKRRPLGIPSFDDKLVQEVIRMILEAIFEKQFENSSHGFRPQRSCHTALSQIEMTFNGAKWFIEGDIKGFFDNINHDVLIDILSERIRDERFLRLIRKLLNAGYVEDWKFHNTYSGTPQGGIVSPILANIYLDKLDKFMKTYIQNFDKGEKRKPNPERIKFEYERSCAVKKLKTETDSEARDDLIKQIRNAEKVRNLVPSCLEMDYEYKKLKYVRYADDFLIGVIGSIQDCRRIKEDIKNFLSDALKLELSDEKTLITHSETPARFLSFDVSVRKSNLAKRDKTGKLRRLFNKKVALRMPEGTVKKKLIDYDAVEFKMHNGREQWKPKCRTYLINNDNLEILTRYNSEILGLYNYYAIARNSATLHAFKYIMEYSMYKTYANKHRTTVANICKKYKRDGVFTITYTNKKGEQKSRLFYNNGFKRKKEPREAYFDIIPRNAYTVMRTSLIERLQAKKCERCGKEDSLEMHHIRKVKDLKGKKDWETLMIARKRKTLAVCHDCHWKIHRGETN